LAAGAPVQACRLLHGHVRNPAVPRRLPYRTLTTSWPPLPATEATDWPSTTSPSSNGSLLLHPLAHSAGQSRCGSTSADEAGNVTPATALESTAPKSTATCKITS